MYVYATLDHLEQDIHVLILHNIFVKGDQTNLELGEENLGEN